MTTTTTSRVTAEDVSTDTVNGMTTLAAMVNGYRMKRSFYGYTHAEAMRMFLADVNAGFSRAEAACLFLTTEGI